MCHPSLDAYVEFWGISDPHTVKSTEIVKIRTIDVHPTKSLLIAADREGKVLKKTIINQTYISVILDRSNNTNQCQKQSMSTRFLMRTDSTVQKVQCTAGSFGSSTEVVVTEVSLDVVEDLGTVELGAVGQVRTSMGSNTGSWKKRPGSKRSNASGGLGSDIVRSSSRPMFYPSPSGDYCAVHWPESTVYVVLRMSLPTATTAAGGSSGAAGSTMEIDRGHCLEFGWVGLDDSFLVSMYKTQLNIVLI